MVVHVVSSVQVQTKQVTEKDQGWQQFFLDLVIVNFCRILCRDGLILVLSLRMFHLPEIKIDVRNNKPIETLTGKACTNVKHLNI